MLSSQDLPNLNNQAHCQYIAVRNVTLTYILYSNKEHGTVKNSSVNSCNLYEWIRIFYFQDKKHYSRNTLTPPEETAPETKAIAK